MPNKRPKPVVLLILDGWGVAPPSRSNAIALAKTNAFDNLIKSYPSMTLQASGEAVGLSWGEIGNSEVGHLNLGSGKLIYQNLPRIDKAIKEKDFFKNETLINAIEHAKKKKKSLHLMGLLSLGGIHGSIDHLFALLELCKKEKIKNVYVHVFLDGRDMPYNSGMDLVKTLENKMKELRVGEIASVSGRFFAMDRDNHWERTESAYKAIADGESEKTFDSAEEAVKKSYAQKIYDEEFVPVAITKRNKPIATVNDGDAIIFFNFRSDRARQITKTFVLPGFEKFERRKIKNLHFVAMTEYEKDLPVEIAFSPQTIDAPLAKVISDAGLTQAHVAETEKYAHVTFFFNGGKEEQFKNEDRILVPSPRVKSYAKKPEMSVKAVNKKMIEAIMSDKYDFIVANFANGDMVAHTGDLKATIKACEAVDDALKRLTEVVLAKDGVLLITSDHGNAEELINLQSSKIDKEHSTYPVPLLIVGKKWEGKTAGKKDSPSSDLSLLKPSGILSDVAPTILKIMNIDAPDDMTGKSLI